MCAAAGGCSLVAEGAMILVLESEEGQLKANYHHVWEAGVRCEAASSKFKMAALSMDEVVDVLELLAPES